MDLELFSRVFRGAEIGDSAGLYVVRQNGLPGKYKRVYRCGAAGIHSSGDGFGSLARRMRTYHDYFVNGGKVFAVLTVPRAIYPGYVRQDLSGKSEVQNREARFHDELQRMGVRVVAERGERSEYFEGSLDTILEALGRVWVGRPGYNLYEFRTGFAVLENPRRGDANPPQMRHKANRRSPRLEDDEPLDQREARMLSENTALHDEEKYNE